jgi:hypothetical protein
MKFFKLIIFTLATTLIALNVFGQANPFINVLPSNSGVVIVGGTIDIVVTIGNTGPVSTVAQAKLRPIIQVPTSVTFLPTAQQTGLPAGWSILTNTGSQLRLCNSTDPIPVNTSRTIILKVQAGNVVTAAQTFSGNINFGNGTTCGAGTSVAGDQPTDNAALSTIEVVASYPLPLILNNFSLTSDNCKVHLNWSTSFEKNIEKFEIEKSETSNAKWKTIGIVAAQSNSSTNTTYYFKDDNIISNKAVMYRLKMMDIDGSFMYSPILNTVLKCDEQNLTVYPNPVTNGKLNVNLNSTVNVEANLTTATGQYIKNIVLKNGLNDIDVSDLSNGVYILSTKSENGINQNVKVTIQK